MAKTLTAKAVEQAQPSAARREIPDAALPAFYLVVQPSGAKSWAVRYRAAGKPRKHTLGTYPALDLSAAREAARAALRAVAKGRDPAVEKQAQRRQVATAAERVESIPQLIEDFLRRHVRPNRRTAAETERMLRKEIEAPWRDRKVGEITRRDVVKLLDSIVDRGAPYTANRVHELLRKMFGWAVERGLIETSPCTGIKPPAVETSRDRVLSDEELRWFWAGSERFDYPFRPFLRLLLLTGQRREEVAGMRWSEIDLDAALWTIPRGRSKNDQALEVPLSAAALETIRAVPRVVGRDLLFSTTGRTSISGFSKAKARLDRFMAEAADGAEIPDWRLHDLRRTAASGMARLGQPVHVVEAVLGHRSGTIRGVAAVYNRYSYADEKRRALEAWTRFVEQLVTDEPAGNVVALRAAQ